jgi:AhpD family alkylhydroperoxidase
MPKAVAAVPPCRRTAVPPDDDGVAADSFLSHLAELYRQGGVTTHDGTGVSPMDARLNLVGNPVAAKFVARMVSAGKVVSDSTLPAATQQLVMLRASQINGCGFCTDMHTKDAAHAGETSTRLSLVAAWREATVFSDAERAALELTEQGTRIADAAGGVTDEVWANAAKHYDEDQLAALVSLIALINAWNRVNVIVARPAGDYQPGQLR